jgi:23S rRNA (cytidine1920-2'-O)/16S rRNA (cytidine1409-2'-O)-methyltransferase
MIPRKRIDRLLVERGLFESRAKAQAAIAAGLVTADAVPVGKASDEVRADAALCAAPPHPWVSRGGVKLAAALDHFSVEVAGRACLDVGASTGGFAEVLLARGARRVTAVDVGRAQLHARLRADPRLVSLEATDIRKLAPAQLGEPAEIITIDVSFISLKLVLTSAVALAAPGARLIALIKPQFEVQRRDLKNGIVRDAALQARVCHDVEGFVVSLGWRSEGLFTAPITGGDGNQEYFVAAQAGTDRARPST